MIRLAAFALGGVLAACEQGTTTEAAPKVPGPDAAVRTRPLREADGTRGASGTHEASGARGKSETRSGTRGTVFLVSLGKRAFPEDLVEAVETSLRDILRVDVRRLDPLPLPRRAYYKPRRRYRADALLEYLEAQLPKDSDEGRVLGLTTVDISTTKGPHRDWGIFGLAEMPGDAAVISMHRLRRGVRDRSHLRFRVATTAVHEVGHTFGLDHCPEPRCLMQDAQGGIENTDSSTGTLEPGCQTKLDNEAPPRTR